MNGPHDDDSDVLHQIAANFDEFREAVMETVKVFHTEQKLFKARLTRMESMLTMQGYLIWIILATLGFGLIAFLASLLMG